MEGEYLDVTTQVGCPVNCLKYCPQEVTVNRYSGIRRFTVENWRLVLSHLPRRLPICFSGICEPFANPKTMDLIDMAEEAGHPLAIYTTLYQASKEDVERLVKHSFLTFVLHLPDGEAMKVPLSEEYKDNVFTVIQKVKNVEFCLMNDLFVSGNRENVTRGIPAKKKVLKLCSRLSNPNFNVLPDGDVSLCPIDFGLCNIVGNLFTESYGDIRKRFWSKRRSFDLCSTCYYNKPLIRYAFKYVGDRVRKPMFHIKERRIKNL